MAREKTTEATSTDTTPSAAAAADEVVRSTALRETPCSECSERTSSGDEPATPPPPTSSRSTPSFWTPAPGTAMLCDHAGLLLFAHALGSLPAAVAPREPLLAQWFGSVLLGAVNVEQTKYLNMDDLSLLLGTAVRFPTPQREELRRLATPATVEAVLRWNLQQLGPPAVGTDFYLDPHTQHYTGMQPVLKGWCAARRWADKLVNSDYIHTAQGAPIYFECTDNYDDLRARFAPLIARLRTTLQWPPQRVLTFVIDRGIYSNEVFTAVLADPAMHLITWQKGYIAGPWDATAVSGTFALEKVRNHAHDVRLYQFAYHEGKYAANPALRQIVVRATHPAGATVQLAILTDDNTRSADEIIRLMFNRWVQENDFKYLNAHFGLNQLTSYRSLPYASLRGELTDRLVPSHAYVQKSKAGQTLLKQKARLLLTADQAQRTEEQRQQRLAELQKPNPNPPPETPAAPTLEEATTAAATSETSRNKTPMNETDAPTEPPPEANANTANTAADNTPDHTTVTEVTAAAHAHAAARRQELAKLKQASQRFEKYRAERALQLDHGIPVWR